MEFNTFFWRGLAFLSVLREFVVMALIRALVWFWCFFLFIDFDPVTFLLFGVFAGVLNEVLRRIGEDIAFGVSGLALLIGFVAYIGVLTSNSPPSGFFLKMVFWIVGGIFWSTFVLLMVRYLPSLWFVGVVRVAREDLTTFCAGLEAAIRAQLIEQFGIAEAFSYRIRIRVLVNALLFVGVCGDAVSWKIQVTDGSGREVSGFWSSFQTYWRDYLGDFFYVVGDCDGIKVDSMSVSKHEILEKMVMIEQFPRISCMLVKFSGQRFLQRVSLGVRPYLPMRSF